MGALSSEDILAMNAMRNNDNSMSAYEAFKVSDHCSRRASGTAITGLVIASAALIVAIAAWVFAGLFTGARTRAAEMAMRKTDDQISTLTNALIAERNERVASTPTTSQTIEIFNQLSQRTNSSLSANAQSALDAALINTLLSGNNNANPLASAIDNSNCGILRVSHWKSAEPCDCGCNG